MSESKLRTHSMDFAVSIINLVKDLKQKKESIISNQIGRSGTSIGFFLHKYTRYADFFHQYRKREIKVKWI